MKSSFTPKSRFSFTLAFLLVAIQVFAQFQRMRIPQGEYRVGDNPTQIISPCIDYGVGDPQPSNSFKYGSKSIKVERNVNGKLSLHTIEDAVQNKWIEIRGTKGGTEVEFVPIDKSGRYTIKVEDSFGIIGGSKKDIENAEQQISVAKREAIKPYDEYLGRLKRTFGEESDIIKYFINKTNSINQSLKIPEKDAFVVKREVREGIEVFKNTVSKLKDEQALEVLTILHGKKLTKQQINEANQLFEKKFPEEYRQIFIKDLESYTANRSKLKKSFGEEFDIVSRYTDEVINNYNESFDLKIASAHAERKGILGEFILWDNVEGNTELISLFKNGRFSDEQIQTLNDVTGYRFRSKKGAFADYTYVSRSDDPNFMGYGVRTTDGYVAIHDSEGLPTQFKTLLKERPNVISDGNLTPEFAKNLSDYGVKFIPNSVQMLKYPSVRKSNVKVIYIASKDVETTMRLYDCDKGTAMKIMELNSKIEKTPNAVMVDSREMLALELLMMKENETPLFIFNNKEGKINFDEPLEVETLDKLGLSISCNTFDLDVNMRTTTHVDFEHTVNGLFEVQTALKNEPINLIEFQKQFTKSYESQYVKSKKSSKGKLVLIGTGTITGLIIIICDDDDDDDDENDKRCEDDKENNDQPKKEIKNDKKKNKEK